MNDSSTVTVNENGSGRYQQTINAGRHTLLADEPLAAGGGDAGPSPFDFLLAALGSCTSITLRMYAQRKGLALTRVSVALSHRKIETEVQGQIKQLDHIERVITLDGELSPEQRQRLLEIANKCPMYRTLKSDIAIDSRIADFTAG
jgi:putative redox protein